MCLHVLEDIFEVLELKYIFAQAYEQVRQDFTYNIEVQRSLFKNNCYYGRFSSNLCFAKSSFQMLQLFGFTRLVC